MRDFVAKMAKQGAVGLAHFAPPPLALGVVGLREVDRYQTVAVTREHRGTSGRRPGVLEKIEGKPVRAVCFHRERQTKLEQRIEQPMLRGFDQAPAVQVLGAG